MQIKETKKMVETVVTTYIAEDGKEFPTIEECKRYENNKQRAFLIEEAEKRRLDIHICTLDTQGSEVCENNLFAWYKINSKEDYLALARVYPEHLDENYELPSYPDIMCIETNYAGGVDEEYNESTDHYIYYLSAMKKNCIDFWNELGYECTLTKKN